MGSRKGQDRTGQLFSGAVDLNMSSIVLLGGNRGEAT